MAVDCQRTEYICKLPQNLYEKAEKELNEKPENRLKDIQALREMVLKAPELKIRTDDEFLLRYLRARKFDVDKSFTLAYEQYKSRLQFPEVFNNFTPSSIKTELEDGVTGVLNGRSKDGCKVVLVRYGKWNTAKYGLDMITKANHVTLFKLIQEEETQINGFQGIVDLKNVGWTHMKQVSPFYARRLSRLIQDAFPARFKGLHFVNQPEIFSKVYNVIKQFMKPKLAERLFLHSDRFEELHDFIDPKNLPEEYGGCLPPYSNKEWTEKLLSCEEEFVEEMKYGLVENVPESNRNKQDAMETLPGTFKKLNTDG